MDELPVILVVEDEEPIQEFVKDALTDGGFDYVAIASGAEALTLLKSGVVKYRALVTDINLKGGMCGWDVARHVREIDPSFPVVYITGAGPINGYRTAFPKVSCCKSRLLPLNLSPQFPSFSTSATRLPKLVVPTSALSCT